MAGFISVYIRQKFRYANIYNCRGSGIVFASARPVGHGVGRAHIFGPDGCDVEASLLALENNKAAAACMEIVDDFGKEVFEVFLCAVDG